MIDRIYARGDWHHVVHFMAFVEPDYETHGLKAIPLAYAEALRLARPFGGRKFHNRSYGGGIAFDSIAAAEKALKEMEGRNEKTWPH